MVDGACCASGTVAVVPRDAPACCPDGRLDACGRCAAGGGTAGIALGLNAAGVCCVTDDGTGFLTEARRCCRSAALVDDCGVCGGDGSSCDRRILGTLALSGGGRPGRFTELLQRQLPGVAVASLETSALAQGAVQRLAAHAWDHNPSSSGSSMTPRVAEHGPGTSVAMLPEAFVSASGRYEGPSAGMETLRRLVLNSAGPSRMAVGYQIMHDAAGGGVVYTAAQLSTAFVMASADATAEGELTEASPLPAVSAQGVPGNGFCELGETPSNSAGDCAEPLLCDTPPRVGAAEPCGGNGVCDPRTGACVCARGYGGIDCGTCDAALGYEEQEVRLPGGSFAVLCSVVYVASQRGAAGGVAAGSSGQVGAASAGAGGDVSGAAGGWDWSWESVRWYVAVGVTGLGLLVMVALLWTTVGRTQSREGATPSVGRDAVPRIVQRCQSAGREGTGRAGSASGGAGAGGPKVVDGLAGVDDADVEGGRSGGEGGGSGGGGGWAVVQVARVQRTAKRTQVQPLGGGATRDDQLVFADDMLE